MASPMSQRGFKIGAGKNNTIEYKIDTNGMEVLQLFSLERRSCVSIMSDEGNIKLVTINSPEFSVYLSIDEAGCITSELPQQAAKRTFEQAKYLYQQGVKMLDVNEKLKEYAPRFSNELEINPFNILGINDGNLEDFINAGKYATKT